MLVTVHFDANKLVTVELVDSDPSVAQVKHELSALLKINISNCDLFLGTCLLEDTALLRDLEITNSDAFTLTHKELEASDDPIEQFSRDILELDPIECTPPTPFGKHTSSPAKPRNSKRLRDAEPSAGAALFAILQRAREAAGRSSSAVRLDYPKQLRRAEANTNDALDPDNESSHSRHA
jgi:hypothetical protein